MAIQTCSVSIFCWRYNVALSAMDYSVVIQHVIKFVCSDIHHNKLQLVLLNDLFILRLAHSIIITHYTQLLTHFLYLNNVTEYV